MVFSATFYSFSFLCTIFSVNFIEINVFCSKYVSDIFAILRALREKSTDQRPDPHGCLPGRKGLLGKETGEGGLICHHGSRNQEVHGICGSSFQCTQTSLHNSEPLHSPDHSPFPSTWLSCWLAHPFIHTKSSPFNLRKSLQCVAFYLLSHSCPKYILFCLVFVH